MRKKWTVEQKVEKHEKSASRTLWLFESRKFVKNLLTVWNRKDRKKSKADKSKAFYFWGEKSENSKKKVEKKRKVEKSKQINKTKKMKSRKVRRPRDLCSKSRTLFDVFARSLTLKVKKNAKSKKREVEICWFFANKKSLENIEWSNTFWLFDFLRKVLRFSRCAITGERSA